MNTNKSQRGQALILITFGIVALVGFTALAVDGGRVFSDRRNAQNAADTSALAAALKYIREIEINPGSAKDLAKSEAQARAASNNYATDADSTVTVVFCDEVAASSDPCDLPSGEDTTKYLRVTIVSDVPMTFGRVLGRKFVTNKVEAITRVQGTKTSGLFNAGAGLYSVRNDNSNDCFKVNGSANLTLHDTGIFVNCSGSQALFLNGTAKIGMDANAQVVGCTNNPHFPISGTGKIDCGVAPQTVNKDTFKDVPTTLPTPTCSSPGSHDETKNIMYPGAFTNKDLNYNTTFMPGTYCFSGYLRIIGSSISGTGTVKLVLSNLSHDVKLNGSSNNFQDLEVYANNSDFVIYGALTANRFRFFGNGNSTFGVQSGSFTSENAYIYSEAGTINIRATATVNMQAPPQGDTFGGLLIYMPWDNPNNFILNGGTNNVWRGTVLLPRANVTYNGNADFKLYGQVIGYTFVINGSGRSDIYFDSNVVFSPPSNPTIELTK